MGNKSGKMMKEAE
jgi:hypothetical protein